MPGPTNIDDIDQIDETDNSADGIVRRLNKIVRVQERLNARLATIEAGFTNPPDPVKPTIQASLDAIRTQTTETTRLVDAITVKNRGNIS